MRDLHVGVTGARKAHQLAEALERRGAVPVIGPLVTSDLPASDEALLAATDAVIAARPDWLAASTGVGMRVWAEVAHRHARYERLREGLHAARPVARGAKAVGGLAAFDLEPEHVTAEETDAAVVAWLRGHVRPTDCVAVQLHGSDSGSYDELGGTGGTGVELITIRPYVAGRLPRDEERARDLVHAVAEGALDVVTFTSPGAARNLFELAAEMGDDVVAGVNAALGHTVAVAVIGPVTAEVFRQRSVPIAVAPRRHRQGELVRELERWATLTRD